MENQDILDQIKEIRTELADELEELHHKKNELNERLAQLEKEIPELQQQLKTTTKIFAFRVVNKNKEDVLKIAETLEKAVKEHIEKSKELEEVEEAITLINENLGL